MKLLRERLRARWLGGAGAALLVLDGCSHSPNTFPAGPPTPTAGSKLAPAEAAGLAARLANDECQRVYGRRPFTPDQHPAKRTGDGYRWGRLEVGAPGGFSALVTFAPDSSKPTVEVYYSTDILTPQIAPGPPVR